MVASRLFAFSARNNADSSPTKGGRRRSRSSAHFEKTTSAPRSARIRPQKAPRASGVDLDDAARSRTRRPSSIRPRGSAAGARENLRPWRRLHRRLALLDLIRIEPARRVHAIDRVHRPHEVVLEPRSEEHTSELQSQFHLVCRLLLEKKK